MKPLSPRQEVVYMAMVSYFRAHGRMPTVRDLSVLLKIASSNGVVCHLEALQRKGYITGVRTTALLGEQFGKVGRGIRFVGVQFVPAFDDSEAGRAAAELWANERVASNS